MNYNYNYIYNGLIFHTDIDECVRGLSGCSHNCSNTVGGYNCSCLNGFELEMDNHTCTGNQCIKKD